MTFRNIILQIIHDLVRIIIVFAITIIAFNSCSYLANMKDIHKLCKLTRESKQWHYAMSFKTQDNPLPVYYFRNNDSIFILNNKILILNQQIIVIRGMSLFNIFEYYKIKAVKKKFLKKIIIVPTAPASIKPDKISHLSLL